MNWTFSPRAIAFLEEISVKEDSPCYIEFSIDNPGEPSARLLVNFSSAPNKSDIYLLSLSKTLIVFCKKSFEKYLEGMCVDFSEDENGTGELEIDAKKIFGDKKDWTLLDQLNQLMASEIIPYLQSQNGYAKVVDLKGSTAIIEFSGGCQGCSMAQVTLKSGIEKKIKEKFPQITNVVDYTDHQKGNNPYYTDRVD